MWPPGGRNAVQELLQPNVQKFIRDHENDDARKIALQGTLIEGVSPALLATQITALKKAKEKFPFLYGRSDILYPPSINLEQASSEVTAKYKRRLLGELFSNHIHKPGAGVDLTGGFGIDSLFLSQLFGEFHYVEPSAELLAIASHNHGQVGGRNIRYHQATAEAFLEKFDRHVDLIYADPSRREDGKKVFRLSESSPDICALQNLILQKAEYLLVKASPLLDIKHGIEDLPRTQKVFVVAVDNEVKEVLFLCHKKSTIEPGVVAINLSTKGRESLFRFDYALEASSKSVYSDPETFLYEPNAAILKAGAFKCLAAAFQLKKIHPHTHLYTHQQLLSEFPGRVFKIGAFVKSDRKEIASFFPGKKANVITRNYPLGAEALKKKLNLTDGGDEYLIAFTGREKKFLTVASRLK